jgi:hypothetical protein
MKNSMEAPQKPKIDHPYDLAIYFWIYNQRKLNEHTYQSGTCMSMFIAAILKIAKIWNQLKCPSKDE